MRSDLPPSIIVHNVDLGTLVDLVATETAKRLTPVIEADRLPGLFDSRELAAFLQISESKVADLVRRNAIPSIMIGACRRFDADAVLAALRGGAGNA